MELSRGKRKKAQIHIQTTQLAGSSILVNRALLVRKFPLKLTDAEGGMVNSCEALINIIGRLLSTRVTALIPYWHDEV